MPLTEEDKSWIHAELADLLRQANASAIEAAEIRLLIAFQQRESPANLRKRTRDAVNRVLDQEMNAPYIKPESPH